MKSPRKRVRYVLIAVMIAVFVTYVGSYIVWSRRGFEFADRYGFAGFYFYPPEDTDEWRRAESTIRALYLPLIYVDSWMALGVGPPLRRLGD